MTSISRVVLLLAIATALPARSEEQAAAGADPAAAWKPPTVMHADRDRREIASLMKRMEEAGAKGDVQAAAALMDFPVLMVTDTAKGEAVAGSWSREQWIEMMTPFYAKPMPAGTVSHGKPVIVLVSDSLATVGAPWTMKMGTRTVSGTSAMLLVRTGGAWKVKSSIEGGWGDMPMPAEGGASAGSSRAAEPAATR